MISPTLFSILIWAIICIGWIGFAIIALSLIRDGFLGLTNSSRQPNEQKEPGDGKTPV